MIAPLLKTALAPLVDRHRRLRALAVNAVACFAAAALYATLIHRGAGSPEAFASGLAALLMLRFAGGRWVENWEPDYRAISRAIEERHPELHALLRTAVEQQPDPQTRRLSYLQQRVVADAVAAARRHQWLDSIPRSQWIGGHAMQWLGVAALAAAFFLMKPAPRAARPLATHATTNDAVTVTPGDTEIERGSGLVVLANFHRAVPGEAVLVLQPRNQPEQRLPLVRNLGDPVFGGGLPEVTADLSYRIEYAGEATRNFAVKVFEHPRLERADATLYFPAYTRLPQKIIPDTHRVGAVEGSKLAFAFNLNKPVKSATLVAKDGTTVPLAVSAGKPLAELRDFALRKSQTFELHLEDADGRRNKVAAQFIVEARPNRRPELKITTPKGDSRVSPLEEVAFRAQVWDDFGISRYGLGYTIGGGTAQDVELGHDTQADEKRELAHLLKLEDAGVKPEELVSWYLWAEDIGPDGKSRRTATDLYFAEVRPFEEIFRQASGDEGENNSAPSGQGEETEKLAASQKQIVSATWNLHRNEEAAASPAPTPKFLQDEPVIRDAQKAALAQAGALGENAEDPRAKVLAENVTKEMQTALAELDAAAQSTEPLGRALAAERAAYNALLKLAAHEFNVRKQKAKNGRQAKQGNQEQLDELELKEDQKRYETRREAEPQQNEQQREQLAILNRLKELAQRQNDVNERVKELQTALQEAKTEKEKEELQRQLKRLREEEQQMLADIDELKQKMEQSPQQSQLADERRQLDQTRGEAQKAAEALEKSEPSKALASGTRAARELQQLREDFRKKTGNQFREEMREMRADARELAERQEEIGEQLKAESGKPQRQTLDDSGGREQLGGQVAKQQAQLGKLTDAMKRVSEQAEAAEPLLARELYDTLRKTSQAATGETLEKTQQLAQRGFAPQAQKFEEKARQEIGELKTGVEKAAESVLGNEAEALRQARAEVDALTQALNREIAQARPDLAQNPQAERSKSDAETPGERKAQERGDGKTPGQGEKQGAAAGGKAQGTGRTQGERNGSEGRGGVQGGPVEGETAGPLTGGKFVEWQDRLRNVEEMLDAPELRTEAARVREVATGVRAEFKRHSVAPNWDLVDSKIRTPLAELRNRLTEELARRESKENLVPIDRDPVPAKYAERVRRYYEDLGRGQ